MAVKDLFQSRFRRGISIADRRHQPVGQDQTGRTDLAGQDKTVIEACVALLALEGETDRERRPYDGQDRPRHRQKAPARDRQEQGHKKGPSNDPADLPPCPGEEIVDFVLSTDVHGLTTLKLPDAYDGPVGHRIMRLVASEHRPGDR